MTIHIENQGLTVRWDGKKGRSGQGKNPWGDLDEIIVKVIDA